MKCTDELECLAGIGDRKPIGVVLEEDRVGCENEPQMEQMAEKATFMEVGNGGLSYADRMQRIAVGKHQTEDWLFAMRCMIKETAEHGNVYLKMKTKDFKKIVGNNDYLACMCVLRADDFVVREIEDFIIIFWG